MDDCSTWLPNFDGPRCGPFFIWEPELHLLYLDESGHPQDPNSEFFVLAGFSVFERQTHWLEKQLDAIVSRFDAYDSARIELHGSEMYGGKNDWRGVAPEARAQAVVDILSLLSDRHMKLRVFASVIEKSQMDLDAILQRSFENVAAAFDGYLYSLYRRRDPQRGLVVVDKSNYEQQLQDLSRVFKWDGHRTGKLRNFAEVPLFLDSKASRLIQMADIVAYWIFRYFQSGDDRGFNLIRPFCCHHSGAPRGLTVEISHDTQMRLANIPPHKYPFPAPTASLSTVTNIREATDDCTNPSPANRSRFTHHPSPPI